ncbi:MAG TPA: serine/threonine-protein kinase [Pirellulales bacterium]|nr:serine/threonine-protein kinase [Pirellulales bacterium]
MSEQGSTSAPARLQGSSPAPPPKTPDLSQTAALIPDPNAEAGADDRTLISRRPAALPGASRPVSPDDLGRMLIGERLNHFELVEFVGGGGMGAVFRAIDTMLNREVALKVLSRDQGAEVDTRRRFQNEAQSAARLDHENIARVYYVGEDRGLNYIVFEFIEGINLRDLVYQRGGPLPLVDAISYTLQLAKALEHASGRDVVHRDIKPSNVLITAEGRAKLVDMGLARLHQVEPAGIDLTASGVTLGTFDYISPEQARDPRCADVRSDIYSLGCTLYFMLTTRPPFPEGTVLQKLLQHSSDEPPDPREFNPEVSDDVASVVRRMLAKNPRQRYQHPRELIDDLLVLAEGLGLPSTAWGVALPVSGSGDRSTMLRHLPWAIPVAALIVGVALIEILDRPGGAEPQSIRPLEPLAMYDGAHEAHGGKSIGVGKAAASVSSTIPASSAASTTSTPVAGSESVGLPAAGASPAANMSDEAAPRPGLLVVGGNLGLPQHYSTVRAACNAAKSGDVIELRYDGRHDERPLSLSNRRFTIRAAEGYRPVVVFRPDESDPLRYPRSMITVAGGRLSIVNVAIELYVPEPNEVPADHWSVFESQRSESLELHGSSITVVNAAALGAMHPDVSIFQVRASPGFDSLMATDESMPEDPVSINLDDCIVRGEATVLRVDDDQPTSLSWENGLIATSERLLAITGGAMSPRNDHRVHLTLRHMTMALGSGFCQMTNSLDWPYLPSLDVDCGDSILSAPDTASFIEQDGIDDVATFRNYVSWNGERNFYEGFDTDALWRVNDQNSDRDPARMTLHDWQAHWGGAHEVVATWGDVHWARPQSTRPASQRTTDDYALADSTSNNMARTGASDGRDAGMVADALPPLPAPEQPEGLSTAR